LPLPAPAVLRLIEGTGIALVDPPGQTSRELVTPTGAAIVATLARPGRPAMCVEVVGHGAGSHDLEWPNVLRVWYGTHAAGVPPEVTDDAHRVPGDESADVVVLETNIDDMNPELYEVAVERLLAAGALDVTLTPTTMKKGRPGTIVTVIAPPPLENKLAEVLLTETTTLGLRAYPARRHTAARQVVQLATRFGPVAVKLRLAGNVVTWAAPEYADCLAAARRHGVPVAEVWAAAIAAAQTTWNPTHPATGPATPGGSAGSTPPGPVATDIPAIATPRANPRAPSEQAGSTPRTAAIDPTSPGADAPKDGLHSTPTTGR
jgi:uncharacterized protein (DUF111 family)